MRYSFLVMTAALISSGCTSLESKRLSTFDSPDNGLVYFLPKQDILIKVVKEAKTTTVTIEATPAYADGSRAYLLNFKKNLVGKNEIDIGVSASGLLSSATSTTTSGLSEALKNLASTVGSINGMSAAPAAKPATCPDGTFTYVYEIGGNAPSPCGMTVTIEGYLPQAATDGVNPPQQRQDLDARSGIYYRQALPYKVRVVGDADKNAIDFTKFVLSPSMAPVRFLPMEKTLFSSNKADFKFVDGMPTKYAQESDGELIGLLKLPADVIGAYFTAIGGIFTSLKTTDTQQAQALAANSQLELAKLKYESCVNAIRSKDDVMIQQLGCGN